MLDLNNIKAASDLTSLLQTAVQQEPRGVELRNLTIGSIILYRRLNRNNEYTIILAKVLSINVRNAYRGTGTLSLEPKAVLSGSKFTKPKSANKDVTVDKDTTLFFVQLDQPQQRFTAEQRKAFVDARKALAKARSTKQDAFSILGLTKDSSPEEFKKRKKELLKEYHPDKISCTDLSEDEFLAKSRQITDAISEVHYYFK